MVSNEMLSSLAQSSNPCIGCSSLSCATCACYCGCESERDVLKKLKVPDVKKECRKQAKISKASETKSVNRTVHVSREFFGYHNKAELYIADSNGMSRAGIYEGDAIIFDMELTPRDGDIVIANINGEKFCRRFYQEGSQARFRREDGVTKDVVTADYIVFGVMVGLMRKIERVG